MKHFCYVLLIATIGSYAYGASNEITIKTIEEIYLNCLMQCREKIKVEQAYDEVIAKNYEDLQHQRYCFKACLAKYERALNSSLISEELWKYAQEMKDKASQS